MKENFCLKIGVFFLFFVYPSISIVVQIKYSSDEENEADHDEFSNNKVKLCKWSEKHQN